MPSEAGFATLSLAIFIYHHEGCLARIPAATFLSNPAVIEAIHSRTP
jgi:hypothetical protein